MGIIRDLADFVTAPFREAAAVDLTENLLLPPGGGYDPDLNLSATQGGSLFYRRLTRDLARDLNPITEERGREIIWALYMTNPQGRRLIQLPRDYVLGGGVEVKVTAVKKAKKSKKKVAGGDGPAANDGTPIKEPDKELDEAASAKLQLIVDKFWNDPNNNLEVELFNKVLELGLFGEQCYPVVVNPKDGSVRLGYIDPAMILRVDRDPKTKRPLAVVTKEFPTNNLQSEVYKIITVDDDPTSESYGRLMGVYTDDEGELLVDDDRNYLPSDNDQVSGLTPTGEMPTEVPPYNDPLNISGQGHLLPQNRARQYRYAGACFYFAVNKVTNATRGTPDLLTVADWIDAFDQFLFARLDRELLMNNFIWDVTLTGATEPVIDAFIKKNPAPKPGTVRAHNDRVKWEAVTPKMESKDAAQDADLFAAQVATGSGVAKTWLNAGLDVNRASAPELAEPTWKYLETRQNYVRFMIEHMVTFALDQAELSGRLPRRKPMGPGEILPEPWHIDLTMPDVRARDIANAGDLLAKVATALAVAKADDAVDTRVEQDVIAFMIQELGIEVDIEAMRRRVAQENAEDEQRALTLAVGSGRAKAFALPGPGAGAIPQGESQPDEGGAQAAGVQTAKKMTGPANATRENASRIRTPAKAAQGVSGKNLKTPRTKPATS